MAKLRLTVAIDHLVSFLLVFILIDFFAANCTKNRASDSQADLSMTFR